MSTPAALAAATHSSAISSSVLNSKSVDQAQLLNRPHRDRRKNPQIGHNRDQPAQSKSRSLDRRNLHPAANDRIRHRIDLANLQRDTRRDIR